MFAIHDVRSKTNVVTTNTETPSFVDSSRGTENTKPVSVGISLPLRNIFADLFPLAQDGLEFDDSMSSRRPTCAVAGLHHRKRSLTLSIIHFTKTKPLTFDRCVSPLVSLIASETK